MNFSFGKMYYNKEEGKWIVKCDWSLKFVVYRRYSSCFFIVLKYKGKLGENVSVFCVLWLKDFVDEEFMELDLIIWKGDFKCVMVCCL